MTTLHVAAGLPLLRNFPCIIRKFDIEKKILRIQETQEIQEICKNIDIPIHLYYIVFALRHVIIFDIFVVLIVVIYLLLIKIECFHTIYTKFSA